MAGFCSREVAKKQWGKGLGNSEMALGPRPTAKAFPNYPFWSGGKQRDSPGARRRDYPVSHWINNPILRKPPHPLVVNYFQDDTPGVTRKRLIIKELWNHAPSEKGVMFLLLADTE